MQIYNPDLYASLVEPGPPIRGSASPRGRSPRAKMGIKSPRTAATDKAVSDKAKAAEKARRFKQFALQQEKTQHEEIKALENKMVEDKKKKEAEFNSMVAELVEGQQLEHDVQSMLTLTVASEHRKCKQKHKQWTDNVYMPINETIGTRLEQQNYSELNRRKRREFQEFLDITNQKGALFRDIVIESEYDPMEPNRHAIKVDSGPMVHLDPTCRVLTKSKEEVEMMQGKSRVKEVTGRDTLEVPMWEKGKIVSTPSGHAMREGDGSARDNKITASKIEVNHFELGVSPSQLAAEFPQGRKVNIHVPAQNAMPPI
jgi:hypothetical protein